VGNDCQFVVDELEASEAVEVMWLLWLTVELYITLHRNF